MRPSKANQLHFVVTTKHAPPYVKYKSRFSGCDSISYARLMSAIKFCVASSGTIPNLSGWYLSASLLYAWLITFN